MGVHSAFQDRVAAAVESHRQRIILARVVLASEEARARAEYYCTFETTGWDRSAFKVYRAVIAFADGSYARAAAESIRSQYTEIITAWIEYGRSASAMCDT